MREWIEGSSFVESGWGVVPAWNLPETIVKVVRRGDRAHEIEDTGRRYRAEERSGLREKGEFFTTLSKILNLPIGDETAFVKALEMIRDSLEIPTLLAITYNATCRSVQGVLFSNERTRPETFYRTLDAADDGNPTAAVLLGRTVLSSGRCVDLNETVESAFVAGALVTTPVAMGETLHGECFVDRTGSKVLDKDSRKHLQALLEAAGRVHERALLHRVAQREAEAADRSWRREIESQEALLHYERLASIGKGAAEAAHEMKNFLAAIQGYSELLLLSEEDEKKRTWLQAMRGKSERVARTMNLTTCHARSGDEGVGVHRVETLLENAAAIARYRVPKSPVNLRFESAADLPSIRADGIQIEQVLVNLIVNALQAMEGKGNLEVRAERTADSDGVLIRVIDDGPGIPEDTISRVFDPFFTTKEKGVGTGLGLGICKRIVEAHRGRLTVSSEPEKGTVFTVFLPVSNPMEVVPFPRREESREETSCACGE